MICPECGQPARVLETRNGDTTVVIRTRYCDNNHIFQSLETPIHNTTVLRVKKQYRQQKLAPTGRQTP